MPWTAKVRTHAIDYARDKFRHEAPTTPPAADIGARIKHEKFQTESTIVTGAREESKIAIGARITKTIYGNSTHVSQDCMTINGQ